MARSNQVEESPTQLKVIHALAGRVRVRLDQIHHNQSLAAGLEKLLLGQSGVVAVRTNVDCSSVVIEFNPDTFDPLKFLSGLDWHHVHPIHHKVQPATLPGMATLTQATFAFEELVRPRAQFAIAGAGLLASIVGAPSVVTGAIVSAAVAPILNRALQSLLHERRLSADFLDGLTCVMLIRGGRYFPAALMSSLIGAGEYIRDLLTQKCRQMIGHQLALSKRSAWLVKGNRRVRVPVNELAHGDWIVVYPGELIPCIGTVVKGKGRVVSASPDMAFTARTLAPDDHVDPDTILLDGKLYVQAQRIVTHHETRNLMREKQETRLLQRTKLHRTALKAGHRAVVPVLGIAALFFALTRNLERSLSIITFDLITGIKITIPVTVLSAMYRAGDSGVVMRNASALESLAEVNAVIFARSGVLTSNLPIVTDLFVAEGYSRDQVTSYAAAVEQQYDHVAAYAIYSCVEEHKIKIPERTNSSLINGLGLKGDVDGHTVIVGRTRLLETEKIDLSPAKEFLTECEKRGDFRVCVAIDNKLAAVIAYREPLRSEIAPVIAHLKELGIKEIAMMTGGSEIAANALAKQAGIDKVYPRTMPEDQARIVKEYRDRGLNVAVVGYDVDDALALEQANLAITLGSGSDVARHRADIVLASDNIRGLVEGIEIARSGMALAHQNLALVTTPNVFGFAVSLFRETNAVIATLINNGSVMIGAANGLRPLLTEDDGEPDDDEELEAVVAEAVLVTDLEQGAAKN